MMVKLTLLLFLANLVPFISAADRFYQFKAAPVIDDELSPDCRKRRPMFLINGQMPGPTIEADEGDTVTVELTNDHPSETLTIHWHGIHQKGTVYADGVAGITQCALAPFQTQNLTFLADPPGTHYWHAHQSLLLADGITGPFIVKPAEDTIQEPYDEEHIIFLQDWFHATGTEQRTGLDSEPFVWIGNPQTNLINGKGVFSGCQEGGASFGDTNVCLDTCNNTEALLDRISVEQGKTYRLRIINSGQLLPFNFAIAGHNLTIVEADGTIVQPVQVKYLDISPGQRYSVLLTANKPENSSVYWIETTARGREVEPKGRAVLDYGSQGLPTTEPEHPAWDDPLAGPELDGMLRTKDVSAYSESFALDTSAEEVSQSLIFVGTQARYSETNLLRWAVNNISNTLDQDILVHSAREAAVAGLTDVPHTVVIAGTPPTPWNYTDVVDGPEGPGIYLADRKPLVLKLERGDVVDIVMQNARALNGVAEVHPWHMHGHAFWVLGQGFGIFDPNTDPASFNLVDPVLRDTLTLWPLQWTAIRMYANNPGVWEFHCHILSHAVMGMGLSIVTSPQEIDEQVPRGALSCLEATSDMEGTSGAATANKWFMTIVGALFFTLAGL